MNCEYQIQELRKDKWTVFTVHGSNGNKCACLIIDIGARPYSVLDVLRYHVSDELESVISWNDSLEQKRLAANLQMDTRLRESIAAQVDTIAEAVQAVYEQAVSRRTKNEHSGND